MDKRKRTFNTLECCFEHDTIGACTKHNGRIVKTKLVLLNLPDVVCYVSLIATVEDKEPKQDEARRQ